MFCQGIFVVHSAPPALSECGREAVNRLVRSRAAALVFRMSFSGFFSGIFSFPSPFPLTCRVATVPVEQVVPEAGKQVNMVPFTVFFG